MKDVDPKIKRLFPWALFLVVAALLLFASTRVHSEEDIWACYGSQRYEAMSSGWPACNEPKSELCSRLHQYLLSHTVKEARAAAKANYIPQFMINRAERCPHD